MTRLFKAVNAVPPILLSKEPPASAFYEGLFRQKNGFPVLTTLGQAAPNLQKNCGTTLSVNVYRLSAPLAYARA